MHKCLLVFLCTSNKTRSPTEITDLRTADRRRPRLHTHQHRMVRVKRSNRLRNGHMFLCGGGNSVFGKKSGDVLRRRACLLGRPRRFFIGCEVEVTLIWEKPVHQHLHTRRSAGISAVLPQRRNFEQHVRPRNGIVVWTLHLCLRSTGEQLRRNDRRPKKRQCFLHCVPVVSFVVSP